MVNVNKEWANMWKSEEMPSCLQTVYHSTHNNSLQAYDSTLRYTSTTQCTSNMAAITMLDRMTSMSGSPICISFTFHEQGRATATGVSWPTVQLCGTVCRLSCVHRTCHWTYFKINWSLSYSELSTKCAFAALANLRGINHLIITTFQFIYENWGYTKHFI